MNKYSLKVRDRIYKYRTNINFINRNFFIFYHLKERNLPISYLEY